MGLDKRMKKRIQQIDKNLDAIVKNPYEKKEIIESHFESFPELEAKLEAGEKYEFLEAIKYPETLAKVTFVVQKSQRGTADAVLTAKEFVGDEPFAVLFGDDVMYNEGRPVIGQLIAELDDTAGMIVPCQDTRQRIAVAAVIAAADCDYDVAVP